MPLFKRIAVLALLVAALAATPGLGQQIDIDAGVTPRGVFYTIAVPTPWNGGLVFWNHGFSLSPATGPPDLGPLQEVQLLQGYAVAASSYSQSGWAVFKTVDDLEELYGIFQAGFGAPTHTILYGASLGGLVTVQAVEQANLGNVVGAMPICGAVGGSRNWDGAVDLRLVYDAICAGVPGANIPGGAKGLPFGSTLTPTDTVTAANVCFGHDLPARSAAQQQRLNRFLAISQLPQSFINTSLGFFATFGMADLVHDPAKLGGRIGFGNKNVDYGDQGINQSIQRVAPAASKRRRLQKYYTPTGDIGNTKIVSMHTSDDGLILVENERMYAEMAPPDLFSVAVVQEATPSHCGFTNAETLAAWVALTGWLAGDPQPSAFTLQVICSAIQAPAIPGPCRFNPLFQIPDPDGRFRPRNAGQMEVRAASVKPAASSPVTPAERPQAAPQPAPETAPAAAPAQEAPSPVRPAPPTRSPRASEAFDEPVEAAVAERFRRKFERR